MTTDLAIAHSVALRPIGDIAVAAGIPESALEPYGRTKAKIGFDFIRSLAAKPDGALVLVSGISPTPAGEGKTTTTIGLADALAAAGKRTMIALREPSLGPCFGVKGGATGGGWAQVGPMEDINLHFTGDFHAITSAHNLLAALLDNHLHYGNALDIDPRRITWRRVMDMNDRALRSMVVGMGAGNGPVREDGFDITVASEVMAVFCLATDLADLQARLGRIVVAQRRDGSPVTAADLKADGAMAVLLKTALMPNLVQSLAGTPALVHGGPFANIAHGCNSLIATRLGLKLADIVVTEAGFGADLGGEKFLDIKSRIGGLKPSCAVVVGTVRALKMHGGVAKADLGREDVAAVRRGVVNLLRHIENMESFGLPVVVALNRFTSDTDAEIAAVDAAVRGVGVEMALCTHWADGAEGAASLAQAVMARIAAGGARFVPLYPDNMPLDAKIRCIAQRIYRAADIALSPTAARKLRGFEAAGYGAFPVCMAKTQMSFSADPHLMGAPTGHILPVRDVRLSAGAGFVVALCGDIMTMPGLPRVPAANSIGLDGDGEGEVVGLF
jgi:formate--tetrahydrofolate ligase